MASSINNNVSVNGLRTAERYSATGQLNATPQHRMNFAMKAPIPINIADYENDEDDWETTDRDDDDNDDEAGDWESTNRDDEELDDAWETTDTEDIAGDEPRRGHKLGVEERPIRPAIGRVLRIGKVDTDKLPVTSAQKQTAITNKAAPSPDTSVAAPDSSAETGIKLKFTGLKPGGKVKCEIIRSKKRNADDIDAEAKSSIDSLSSSLPGDTQAAVNNARQNGYSEIEIEVALILAQMSAGNMEPPSKKAKLTPTTSTDPTASAVPTTEAAPTTEAGPSRPRRTVASSSKTATPFQGDSKDLTATKTKTKASTASTKAGPSRPKRTVASSSKMPAPSRDSSEDFTIIKTMQSTRKQRIVDPNNLADAVLISRATKAGSDIYDSDAEDLPGPAVKGKSAQPDLFRNIPWGPAADDYSSDTDFPTEPEFHQFVRGRWERMEDGSLRDQKYKLLVKLTSKDGRKLIFKNPPPKDWNDQKATTMLNKRISQQIRRNTDVRFRGEVEPYIHEERVWINDHLVNGKPANGWKEFVAEFNEEFEGSMVEGCKEPRSARTHSSLTKEIERFGNEFYKLGKVPVTKEWKGKATSKTTSKTAIKGKGKAKMEEE